MESFDLLVIGGGINGAAIARDAAGRGLSVLLVEKDDLAAHTSSASSKLAHGGLRYLERYEFRLVRESLAERETLLRNAPHIVRPLRFILPIAEGMRPRWMLRLGLLLYDLLALRGSLPRSRGVGRADPVRAPLKDSARLSLLSYWDAWADDARLVALNALDAAERGAEIATRTEFLSARRAGGVWRVALSGGREVTAPLLVNAAGPWVGELLGHRIGEPGDPWVRLVRGSHIVVPALWEGDHAYILQQADGRVVFAIPFEGATMIGTTDFPASGPEDAAPSEEEIAYLCAAANLYFQSQVSPADVIWSFAGIRTLSEDLTPNPKDSSREHRFELGDGIISVFAGKLTTARAVASEALDHLGVPGLKFTRTSPLPGGDLFPPFLAWLEEVAAWMDPPLLARLSRAYGTRMQDIVGSARRMQDLGRHFGHGLHEAELTYLTQKEFARTADDVLWRRTKLGLRFSAAETEALGRWLEARHGTKRRIAVPTPLP
jgi:glycerol-3-phosphate dehydrogenase